MYTYDYDKIKDMVRARAITRKKIAAIVRQYATYTLPDSVLDRIYSRAKLYNFLLALDYSHESICTIMRSNNLSVPCDRRLRPRALPKPEQKIDWLERLNLNDDDLEINI